MGPQLDRQRLRQHLQTRFAGRIRRALGPGPLAQKRTDVDDLPLLPPRHPPRPFPGQTHRALQIDTQDLPPHLRINVKKRGTEIDPRVVDQNVDRPHSAFHGPDALLDRLFVGNVEALKMGIEPLRSELIGGLPKRLLVTPVQHHRSPRIGQPPGDHPPETPR